MPRYLCFEQASASVTAARCTVSKTIFQHVEKHYFISAQIYQNPEERAAQKGPAAGS